MAKFKPARPPAGRKSAPNTQKPNAIGCVVLIALLFVAVFVIMYLTVRQG